MEKAKTELKEIPTEKVEPVNKDNKVVDEQKALIAKLQAENDALQKKLKYQPIRAEIPKEQLGLPEGMQESQIKTTVRDMSTIIKEKMLQLNDLATMEIMMDAHVRMRNRLESIKKMSSAQHIKVRGIWKTTAPQMHVSNLQGKKISNDEMEISMGVFEVDANGNKKMFIHYADVLMHDGSTIKRATSAEYRIGYEVIETIKTGKPITREIIKIDRIQN